MPMAIDRVTLTHTSVLESSPSPSPVSHDASTCTSTWPRRHHWRKWWPTWTNSYSCASVPDDWTSCGKWSSVHSTVDGGSCFCCYDCCCCCCAIVWLFVCGCRVNVFVLWFRNAMLAEQKIDPDLELCCFCLLFHRENFALFLPTSVTVNPKTPVNCSGQLKGSF